MTFTRDVAVSVARVIFPFSQFPVAQVVVPDCVIPDTVAIHEALAGEARVTVLNADDAL